MWCDFRVFSLKFFNLCNFLSFGKFWVMWFFSRVVTPLNLTAMRTKLTARANSFYNWELSFDFCTFHGQLLLAFIMFFEFWKKASSMKLYSQTDHFRTRFGQIGYILESLYLLVGKLVFLKSATKVGYTISKNQVYTTK